MSFEFKAEKKTEQRDSVKIPDRTYSAVLTGYRQYQRQNRETGAPEDRLAWSFNVYTKKGEFEIAGFTSTKWGNAERPSIAREWVAALTGLPVSSDKLPTKLDDVVGRACQVLTMTLGEGDSARSIVKAVLPSDEDINF